MAIGETKTIQTDLQTSSPQMTQDGDYTSLSAISVYEFMTHAFDGVGGFRNGHYLVPHTAELKMNYDRRRDLAFYKNYVYPIIRATIDPVFNAEIKRIVNVAGVPVVEGYFSTGFIDDVMDNGNSLQDFVDMVLTNTTLHGVSFVVMDNTQEAGIEQNKTVAMKNRLFPYVFNRTISDVDDCKTDKRGHLEWIRFYDGVKEQKENEKLTQLRQYIYYDAVNIKKQVETINGDIVDVDTIAHGLGIIPVIVSYYDIKSSATKDIMSIDPPFYDIARINHSIYNKDSLITAQERSQGFAMPYLQEDIPGSVVYGRHTYLSLPMATTIPPGYAAPPPAILAQLVANNETLREDLFRIAGQKGIDFRSKAVKSGNALEWEFIAQEVTLKKMAKRAQALEYAIMDMFRVWTKEVYEYQVEYPEQYRPDSEENEIADCDKLLMMSMPSRVASYIRKQAFIVKAKKWDEDEVNDLLPDFDLVKEEASLEPVEPVETENV